jgi:hypothetical protein
LIQRSRSDVAPSDGVCLDVAMMLEVGDNCALSSSPPFHVPSPVPYPSLLLMSRHSIVSCDITSPSTSPCFQSAPLSSVFSVLGDPRVHFFPNCLPEPRKHYASLNQRPFRLPFRASATHAESVSNIPTKQPGTQPQRAPILSSFSSFAPRTCTKKLLPST